MARKEIDTTIEASLARSALHRTTTDDTGGKFPREERRAVSFLFLRTLARTLLLL
jgi:hypothetical protein